MASDSDLLNILHPNHRFHFLLILFAGAVSTLGFEPFGFWPILFVSFSLLLHSWEASTPKQSLIYGWCFGVGLQCSGVSWIFWSLHDHGGAPVFMACLTIFLLACYLAIYTALAGYVVKRFCGGPALPRLLLLFPLSWGLFEWLQGYALTGFAWMQPGYALIDTPLSGFATVLGNHAVGVVMLTLIGVVFAWRRSLLSHMAAPVLLIGMLLTGWALKSIAWTSPSGEPISVSLVQGNIAQELKWKREMRVPTLRLYRELTLAAEPVDLVIWPETALPGYRHRLTRYLDDMRKKMQERDSDLLLGLFIRDPDGEGYFNGVMSIDGQEYHKRHLVPLGEYIPLRGLIEFFRSWVDIPMSDIAHGDDEQALIEAAGVKLGVNICFEDAFSRDVRRDLPEASVLVNVSNDAWFDGSHETMQHHTIARMRALETGRYMVRATNTGFSSVIDEKGRVLASSPVLQTHVLRATVQPMQGATPYVLWGDAVLVGLALLVLGGCGYRRAVSGS